MSDGLINVSKFLPVSETAKKLKIAFQYADPTTSIPSEIHLRGKTLKNFGNCDFLGFQDDERVKQAAINAIRDQGIMQCNSRAYVSNYLYEILEEKMTKIMGSPSFVARTTTYSSLSVIPMVIGKKDVIILDHQVHNSVQMASLLAAAQGTHIVKVKHNNMAKLDDLITKYSKTHEKVWYFFDGVYSTVGDFAEIESINTLLNTHDKMYAFCDDAWGMSWSGKNGKGFAKDKIEKSEKLVMVSSLQKGFGAGGGGIVIMSDEIQRNLVRDLSPVQVFSGPLSNAVLASAIAIADVHLSEEIYTKQNFFLEKVKLAHLTAKNLNIRLESDSISPVCFVRIGNFESTTYIAQKLMAAGYYLNISSYPSIPANLSGLRIVINSYVSDTDIKNLFIHIEQYLAESFDVYNIDMKMRKASMQPLAIL